MPGSNFSHFSVKKSQSSECINLKCRRYYRCQNVRKCIVFIQLERFNLLFCNKSAKWFYIPGMLLLEDSSVPVTLQTADGVGFWNGLHYINAPGVKLSQMLY